MAEGASIMELALLVFEKLSSSQLLMMLALPLVLGLAAVEWFHFRGTDKYNIRDSAASLVMGASYVIVSEGLVLALLVYPAYDWIYNYRLFTQSISPLSILGLFILVDFLFYLFHLAAHRIRFLWGVHEVHHASEHFNFTVAFRQSMLYAFVGVYLFFVPALLLGFPPHWVLLMLAARILYSRFFRTPSGLAAFLPQLNGY